MRNRLALTTAAVAALLFASSSEPGFGAAANVPAYVTAAVADTNRPQANKDLDAARHPAEMMAFAGVQPGNKVVEFWPGGGYVTRLLSKIVGPSGKVYSINAPTFPQRLKDLPKEVTGNAAFANVVLLEQPFAELKVPEPVDVVWTSENYHDFQNTGPFKADTAAMDKAVFAALKPGGLYIVTDYTAAAGSGTRDTQSLHRIDPDFIKREVTAAGFVLEAESNVLANPADNRTERSRQGSDQVFFKFRKPR
jgi:predicted methyltransferase